MNLLLKIIWDTSWIAYCTQGLGSYKGIRTTYGSLIHKDYIPDFNSLIVDRTQDAGAITIGKTNTPEFGAGFKL